MIKLMALIFILASPLSAKGALSPQVPDQKTPRGKNFVQPLNLGCVTGNCGRHILKGPNSADKDLVRFHLNNVFSSEVLDRTAGSIDDRNGG